MPSGGEEQAATKGEQPSLFGVEVPPAPVSTPPAGAALRTPQMAGSVASVGRLGSRSLLVVSVVLAVVVVVHAVDDDDSLALGDGLWPRRRRP